MRLIFLDNLQHFQPFFEKTHYPEILIYKKGSVRITATTSDEGGVTENDIGLIESIEILVS